MNNIKPFITDTYVTTQKGSHPSVATRIARTFRYRFLKRGLALTENERRILKFKNAHTRDRCFIIGNGPSLNKLDLTKLKNEITIGVNAIFLNEEKMGFLPTHYVVEDTFVAEDRAPEINRLRGPHKWFGNYLKYCINSDDRTQWLNVRVRYDDYPDFPHFSEDAGRMLWVGGTVSFINLQLAYYMGFKEVYLIGFDHNYVIPDSAKVEGLNITSSEDDPNHFHPDYFGKGYRWHDPNVARMEKSYIKARRHFEADGRSVYNATAGGKLEVFPRKYFSALFK